MLATSLSSRAQVTSCDNTQKCRIAPASHGTHASRAPRVCGRQAQLAICSRDVDARSAYRPRYHLLSWLASRAGRRARHRAMRAAAHGMTLTTICADKAPRYHYRVFVYTVCVPPMDAIVRSSTRAEKPGFRRAKCPRDHRLPSPRATNVSDRRQPAGLDGQRPGDRETPGRRCERGMPMAPI